VNNNTELVPHRHTGKGVANPIATIWAAAEMLKWLGEDKAYEVLMDAIKASLAQQETTADLGGKLNTQGVTDAVKRRIEASGL
jgi:isocitrate/isopropylmalate dehydrogenase